MSDFAGIVIPTTALLKKKAKWRWGKQHNAFETLKKKLTTAPVLACPDFDRQFILQTDTSDFGLGAVLTQMFDGRE